MSRAGHGVAERQTTLTGWPERLSAEFEGATVQSVLSGVMDMLDSLPEKCESCGDAAWTTDDNVRIKCGSCGEDATFTNGDDLTIDWLKKIQAEKNLF